MSAKIELPFSILYVNPKSRPTLTNKRDLGEGGAGGMEGWRVCANDDRKSINNITG